MARWDTITILLWCLGIFFGLCFIVGVVTVIRTVF